MFRLSWRVVLLVLVAGAASCSDANSEAGAGSLLISYEEGGEAGFIDQTVTIVNIAGVALAPVVEYTPLDSSGEVVPGLVPRAAFGSDRGLLMVAPGAQFDVLAFDGARSDEVVDVRARVVSVEEFPDVSGGAPIEPVPLSEEGEVISKFDPFSSVLLTNPESEPVTLRVVCLDYDSPPEGVSQQATEMSVVSARIVVPASSDLTVPASEDFARRTRGNGYGCSSLKAHPTP
jgi:hypothetical protein